jgi:hypothetical protein
MKEYAPHAADGGTSAAPIRQKVQRDCQFFRMAQSRDRIGALDYF